MIARACYFAVAALFASQASSVFLATSKHYSLADENVSAVDSIEASDSDAAAAELAIVKTLFKQTITRLSSLKANGIGPAATPTAEKKQAVKDLFERAVFHLDSAAAMARGKSNSQLAEIAAVRNALQQAFLQASANASDFLGVEAPATATNRSSLGRPPASKPPAATAKSETAASPLGAGTVAAIAAAVAPKPTPVASAIHAAAAARAASTAPAAAAPWPEVATQPGPAAAGEASAAPPGPAPAAGAIRPAAAGEAPAGASIAATPKPELGRKPFASTSTAVIMEANQSASNLSSRVTTWRKRRQRRLNGMRRLAMQEQALLRQNGSDGAPTVPVAPLATASNASVAPVDALSAGSAAEGAGGAGFTEADVQNVAEYLKENAVVIARRLLKHPHQPIQQQLSDAVPSDRMRPREVATSNQEAVKRLRRISGTKELINRTSIALEQDAKFTSALARDHERIEIFIQEMKMGTLNTIGDVLTRHQPSVRARKDRNASDPLNNFCARGRLLPKLYVLGAQKSGTTTMSEDLEKVGIMHAGDWKEFHYFDKQYPGGIPTPENETVFDIMRKNWFKQLPVCPKLMPKVLADFTPSNMRMIPLPDGNSPTGTQWGLWTINHPNWSQVGVQQHPINVPYFLHRLIGHRPSRRVTFVILLREPLARMQSSWYASSKATEDDPTVWQQCADCKAVSFEAALSKTIDRMEQEPAVYDDWLWASLYARHLEGWMRDFDAKQFFIIPYLLWVRGGMTKVDICRALNGHMEEDFNCYTLPYESRANAHEHPAAREDLSAPMIQRFDKLMEMENRLLYELLAVSFSRGAGLAEFKNKWRGHNKVAQWMEVKDWLRPNW